MVDFIKQTLKKVNREQRQQHPTPIALFTPQMLTTMNVTQLQIVINEIYDFRGILNETLVKNLMERDELLSKRDVMLMTIEKKSGRKRSVERENSC
jgi:Schwannomin-interacting protein 1